MVPSADWPHPTHQVHLNRGLLYQDSMTYYKNVLVPSGNYPSLIEPTCTEPYYTRTVLPITECSGTKCWLTPPPANQAHLYRALLHQDSMTYYRMHWYLKCQLPPQLIQSPATPWQYYLLKNAEEPNANWPYPNRPQVYIALLHHNSITYWEMKTYKCRHT